MAVSETVGDANPRLHILSAAVRVINPSTYSSFVPKSPSVSLHA